MKIAHENTRNLLHEHSDRASLLLGDCLDQMRPLADNSVDAIVTDPPYALTGASGSGGFMGSKWDSELPTVEMWKEALRVAKPGAHLLAFGGTRTYHRLACAIEDAGWEVRDCIMWVYGSGFPKSMDVSKAIDRSRNENHDRALEFTRWLRSTGITAEQIDEATKSKMSRRLLALDAAASIATEEKFEQLRPLLPEVPEFIERLVAERTGVEWSDYAKRHVVGTRNNGSREGANTNFLQSQGDTYDQTVPYSPEAAAWNGWGTTLKPACEPIVVARKPLEGTVAANVLKYGTGAINIDACRVPTENESVSNHSRSAEAAISKGKYGDSTAQETHQTAGKQLGRFPANLIHDGSPEVLACFPESKGQCGAVKGNEPSELTRGIYGKFSGDRTPCAPRGDSGSAARFFYCAKAARSERGSFNDHCTVKPLALMRWLITLVTPPGGTVLDPFMGSGTTGVAARQLDRPFIGIEREPHYYEIAQRRVLGEVPQVDSPEKKPVPKQDSPDTSQMCDGYPTDPKPIQGELF